jgi:hypothetical protein
MPVETKALDAEIYRVGRRPDPWAFIDWAYAGTDGTFGGRWDDANGRYRVIYASSQRLGAFLETLAQFRPDPSVIAESQAIEIVEGDEETAPPGTVPLTWCREREITTGVTTEGEIDEFVVVGAAATLAILRAAFAGRLVHFGLEDLDAATIRRTAPRAFTQEVSSFIERQRDEAGGRYGGIYFRSKLGDEFENWAIFEQEWMRGHSPVLSVSRGVVDPNDGDLEDAMRILGLRLGG